MSIHWMRVVLCALLLDVVLLLTLVPLSFANVTLFVAAVPIGVFVFGYLSPWWSCAPCRPPLGPPGALMAG